MVIARLAARNVESLPFPVHSDPEHKLLAQPREDIFINRLMEASKKYGGDYIDYDMVQPALILLDSEAKVLKWWSWKKVIPDAQADSEMMQIEVEGGPPAPLVTVRPLTEDILPSILEGREVKTNAVMRFN